MSPRFNVLARYRTKDGTTSTVLSNLSRMAAETRKEPGNLSYEFFRGVEDDRQIVIVESYRSAEDFEFHRQSPHFLAIGASQIIPELESRTVTTFVSDDGSQKTP